ncbi:MAG: tRNA preQ1(34) S-adenosylmethionine ribosyltransferase-isomerase QueA [Ruminococcaceae bacterium]|nr:tRNA preQ1(34) S-adenosylmethionine ribosyltransferase-isomerase QueA [Oscillospiraceae bacterium]
MNTDEFDYYLPEERIAQTPLADRTASRLLVLDKNTGEYTDDSFKNIKGYLKKGDCLVLNDTRVIPARLYGVKKGSGGAIEFLLLHRYSTDEWEVALKPGRKAKVGAEFVFGEGRLCAEVLEILEGGNRRVRFSYDGLFENILEELGEMPLPHYIKEKLQDRQRYQTVYSKYDGSAAAPTAGLHFTNELLAEIEAMGVKLAFLTLHVGLGTFRPVKVTDVTQHKMHSEHFIVSKEAADIINETKKNGGRVICVGTTSCRTVESAAENGLITPKSGETDIFIYPGYQFKVTDALITNFHLPKSTLVMLVSALAGKENILEAYNHAVKEGYRFFSFGDAMFIH